eukprot:Em0003g1243a
MDTIDNQQWFLGKMTGEAAVTILMASAETNTFVVYRDKDRDVLMFAMRHTCLNAHRVGSNTSTDKVSHLEIQCQDGRYSVTGQMEFFTDAVRAVNTFAATHDPRLCSALSLESLITNSITVAPPPYSQAQRALKPDVAPLPRIPDLQREDSPLEPSNSSAFSNVPVHPYRPHRPNHLLHCIITCFCPCYLVVWLCLCCVYGC